LTATATDSGSVTYFVPKNNTVAGISDSAISGEITTDIATKLYTHRCNNLTSITANNAITLGAVQCPLLTSIIAPKLAYCDVRICSLPSGALGEILYAAYLDDRQSVYFDFSGGTNANDTAIDSYLQATYSVTLAAVILRLDVTGTIILNG
jgi:hypothetical protein